MKTKMLDTMKHQLEVNKTTLAKWQADFKDYTSRDIADASFERNAIQALLVMKELKSKIDILETNIQILEFSKR